MLNDLLVGHVWAGLLLWIITYSADFCLTMLSSRMYQSTGRHFVATEGSMELTKEFEADVDSLRWASPRFLKGLFGGIFILLVFWFVRHIQPTNIDFYMVILGALVLRQLAIIVRHVNNLANFHLLGKEGAATGRSEYKRWVAYRKSGTDLIAFGALYLFVFAMTGQPFWVGGSLFCIGTGAEHIKQGKIP